MRCLTSISDNDDQRCHDNPSPPHLALSLPPQSDACTLKGKVNGTELQSGQANGQTSGLCGMGSKNGGDTGDCSPSEHLTSPKTQTRKCSPQPGDSFCSKRFSHEQIISHVCMLAVAHESSALIADSSLFRKCPVLSSNVCAKTIMMMTIFIYGLHRKSLSQDVR